MRDYQERSSLGTFLVGMIMGALGAFVALLLSKPENRKRIREEAEDLKERGEDAFSEIRKGAQKAKDDMEKGIKQAKEAARK